MTDLPAAAGSGRAPGGAEPGLIHRHDLVAALNRAARKRVTIISAPAGTGKTSLLRAWADQPGQDGRIAFMTVRPGQHDMQLFWLTMLGAVRAAAGTGEGGARLPVTPGSSGSALADKVLSELEECCDRFVHSFAMARQRCEEAIMVAARHGWDAEPVIAPALAALANALTWTGQFDLAEHWLDRARRATQADGEPGIRLLVCLTSAIIQAARGYHHRALEEFAAARRMQALMVGEHGLTIRVKAWMIATQARLGLAGQAQAALAALDDRQANVGEIRNAAAVIRLAQPDPAAARLELRAVLDGTVPVLSYLTRVEAHLLDALACRDLGDERGSREAAEQALNLAEPDRLILPFAMTGAWQLLETLPRHRTSHAALVTDILDAIRGPGRGGPDQPAMTPAEELSRSELRVLRYLPTNLTRREIACELSVSVHTVDSHIRRVYAKLGTADRTAAVQRGRELRLLSAGRT